MCRRGSCRSLVERVQLVACVTRGRTDPILLISLFSCCCWHGVILPSNAVRQLQQRVQIQLETTFDIVHPLNGASSAAGWTIRTSLLLLTPSRSPDPLSADTTWWEELPEVDAICAWARADTTGGGVVSAPHRIVGL